MSGRNLAIVREPATTLNELEAREERRRVAEQDAVEQVHAAAALARLPAEAFWTWPRRPLQEAIGGVPPGTITVIVGASGQGKSTFVADAMDTAQARGDRPFIIGTETPAKHLRMMLACRHEGIDFAEIRRGTAQRRSDWADLQRRLNRRFREQVSIDGLQRIRFASGTFLSPGFLNEAIAQALDFDARVVFLDHLDNLSSDSGRSTYEDGLATMRRLLALTQQHGLRVIATSQTNLAGMANDPLRTHRPVRRESVRNGGFKIELCDTAIGLYRPLRDNLDKVTLQDWREGRVDTQRILAPHTTALNVMKCRSDGSVEGTRLLLGFEKGKLLDAPPAPELPRDWYGDDA